MPNPSAEETPVILRGGTILEGFGPDDAPILHRDAAILVRDGHVVRIGSAAQIEREVPGATRLGDLNNFIIPGLINAHHHVGLTPLQLGSPDHPLELWFATRLRLRDVDLYLDTLYSAFEMIESGVTTVQHLHSRAPGDVPAVIAAAEEVLRAYRTIGMRVSYSMAMRDQNRLAYEDDALFAERVPEEHRPALRAYFARLTLPLSEQIEIFHSLRTRHNCDLARVQLAPSNLHWLSDGALEEIAALSAVNNSGMHMHLLETPYQRAYARRRTGGSAFSHIARLGLAGPRLTVGHGVWMSEDDIDLCGETGTRLCHNCSSNFRLKSGVAPLNRFRARGIPVAIGIDEAGLNDDRDMLQELRLVLRAHRQPGLETPHPSPAAILRMATEHGAGTTPFGPRIGRLSPGCAADAVLLDWRSVTYPYQSPDIPPVDVLVQRARSYHIRSVLVAGRIVYENGRFMGIDRNSVLTEIASRLARPLTSAEDERRRLSDAVVPVVKDFYRGYLSGAPSEPLVDRSNEV